MTAILELTGNPHVIMPALFALVTAQLVARQVLRTDSAFVALSRARGLDLRHDPVAQSLRRLGVSAAMDQRFVLLPRETGPAAAHAALAGAPRWVLVCDGPEPTAVLAARDLAGALSEGQAGATLDLLEMPGDRRPCAPIHPKATLPEAAERLAAGTAEALFVVRPTRSGASRILGVLTREDIDAAYRP